MHGQTMKNHRLREHDFLVICKMVDFRRASWSKIRKTHSEPLDPFTVGDVGARARYSAVSVAFVLQLGVVLSDLCPESEHGIVGEFWRRAVSFNKTFI